MTTKLRVVFDASAQSSTGISLNDSLMGGPNIQQDIFSLLLRFRLHNYVITGDLEKMYLQIKVQREDQRYLRILWRNANQKVNTYQFNRLIFGLKPASYLAIRCIHQLASDKENQFPTAAQVLKNDMYVDDLLTGADTIEEAAKLFADLTELLDLGGFKLRQCASNSSEILEAIPETNVNLQLQEDKTVSLKTLGLYWNASQDRIIYTAFSPSTSKITKRVICSEIAKIYDPLGFLNPVVVIAKLIIQDLWKLRVNWDESLPLEIVSRWELFTSQLSLLDGFGVQRHVLKNNHVEIQVHGFADASEKAYGACLYIRSIDASGEIHVNLLCAKSRVAPIKNVQTIPRLELCAAVLLSHLYTAVKTTVLKKNHKAHFWTDSMITLHWIRTSPHLLKTFVANRVSDIQNCTNVNCWNYISTKENPADVLSRGQMPSNFIKNSLWLSGPTWLSTEENVWPKQPLEVPKTLLEGRTSKCLLSKPIDDSILHRFSSYVKLQRVVAICLRFKYIKTHKGTISVEELQRASICILRLVQRIEFASELKDLKKDKSVSSRSKLLSLNPFLDDDDLIRVGGRLHNSSQCYSSKHLILLPRSNPITKLLIGHHHTLTFHGGIQTTLYSLRQHYWPIDGRNQVRNIIRTCIRCVRESGSTPNYVMGTLPEIRTMQVRPFTNTGVDYCSPFYIKERKHRNRSQLKVYVAVFVCLSTKAVHMELVSDLTTEGFLAALKRFISRRGLCASIHSDNATNFVGARNEIREIQQLLNSEEHNKTIHTQLSKRGIDWKFSPPYSPHFGGIWEAAVKSFKHHLRRTVGTTLFTFEQLNTLIIEIEAILNSRPISPLSADPNDFLPLTPAHLLIGDSLHSLPERDFGLILSNRLSSWQHIQKMKQHFWNRWHKEYLNELNIRKKWLSGDHSISNGTLVLIRGDNVPPFQWSLARVIESHPGQDGIIRTVTLKTSSGTVQRAVKKLVILPIDSSS